MVIKTEKVECHVEEATTTDGMVAMGDCQTEKTGGSEGGMGTTMVEELAEVTAAGTDVWVHTVAREERTED